MPPQETIDHTGSVYRIESFHRRLGIAENKLRSQVAPLGLLQEIRTCDHTGHSEPDARKKEQALYFLFHNRLLLDH